MSRLLTFALANYSFHFVSLMTEQLRLKGIPLLPTIKYIFLLSDGERSEPATTQVPGLGAVQQVDEAAHQGPEGQVQTADCGLRLQAPGEGG